MHQILFFAQLTLHQRSLIIPKIVIQLIITSGVFHLCSDRHMKGKVRIGLVTCRVGDFKRSRRPDCRFRSKLPQGCVPKPNLSTSGIDKVDHRRVTSIGTTKSFIKPDTIPTEASVSQGESPTRFVDTLEPLDWLNSFDRLRDRICVENWSRCIRS